MKKDLREKYLIIRKDIKDRDILDKIIFNKLIINSKLINSKGVLIYVSRDDEVDTIKIINYLLNIGKLVAIPKIENGKMNFYYINSLDDTYIGKYGIREPNNNNNNMVTDYSDFVSVTPGICFSLDGYRIGYGGGFYDRFYAKYNLYKIGLCYRECLTSYQFIDEYDQKVDEIITD